ncbi:MFS transporter [Chitinispirillales bacterium ANBcel5]|uniref:MFS transporter n=1 Tax=Cellulosispirillum alkaliphilum TaxID=3039283 RepID=UPI002A5868FC|nr:MFS transporter [Chitinispirillales bacterium ANBcel5]
MTTRAVVILYIGIALAMVGYGIAIPLFPFYIESLGGRGIHLGLLVSVYGLMQLLFAPLWGSLSDTHGRKPFLLLGMLGLGTGMLLMGLATRLWMLYGAQVLAGALSCATFPAAMAMISDLYSDDKRSAAMGRVGGAAGLGVILGPGIGGVLAFSSLSVPFFIAAAFSFLTLAVMVVWLPESLEEKNRATKKNDKNWFFKVNFHTALVGPMAIGLIAAFAVNFGKSGFTSVYGLFAWQRYGYGPAEVGLLLMIMSLMYAVAQGVLVGPLTKRFGEVTLIRLLFPVIALGFIVMLLATHTVTVILSISMFMLFIALLKPVALSYVSRQCCGNQGAAMGVAESFMSIGRIAGPLWAGFVFDININFPYLSIAAFFGLMFLMSFRGRVLKGAGECLTMKCL